MTAAINRARAYRFLLTPAALFLACCVTGTVCAQAQSGSIPGPTPVVLGLSVPTAVASDRQGNLYIVDVGCGLPNLPGADCNVYKETVSGGAYTQSLVTSFTSTYPPMGVAVDTLGNVYISVTGKGVYKETPAGASYTQTTVGCAFASPMAVAVDGVGNLFVADSQTGRIYREKESDTCSTATVVASRSSVSGVAVDACGSVYFGSTSGGGLVKETLSGGGYVESGVGSGNEEVAGVAVDRSGDVFFSTANAVNVWIPNGRGYTQKTLMAGTQFALIAGVAVDGVSTAYYADYTNGNVGKVALSFTLPAPLVCPNAPAPPTGLKVTAQPN